MDLPQNVMVSYLGPCYTSHISLCNPASRQINYCCAKNTTSLAELISVLEFQLIIHMILYSFINLVLYCERKHVHCTVTHNTDVIVH